MRGANGQRQTKQVHQVIYDITPTISEALAVWPGDTPPTREVLCDLSRGDTTTLSTWHTTVHVGAHIDAPSHYGAGERSIDACTLDTFVGPAQVLRIDAVRGSRIGPEALCDEIREPRVLIATGSYPDPSVFNEDFCALCPKLIDRLAGAGVRLIGIDTPSVDLFDSKDLPAHKRCLAHDVAILEGIVLDDVPAGVYELIALPLKLAGFDASPVRAILRTLPVR